MLGDVVDGAFLGRSHSLPGEGLLDRIEAWRVMRQIPEPHTDGLDETAPRGGFVTAKSIHADDVARPEQKDRLDVSAEASAVDRTIEQARRGEAVAAQRPEEGQHGPMAMRRKCQKDYVSVSLPYPGGSHDTGLLDQLLAAMRSPRISQGRTAF